MVVFGVHHWSFHFIPMLFSFLSDLLKKNKIKNQGAQLISVMQRLSAIQHTSAPHA